MPDTNSLVATLARAYSLSELVSPDDRRVTRLLEGAAEALSGSEDVDLWVEAGALAGPEGRLDPGTKLAGELARDLELAGVDRVRFPAGVAVESLETFVRHLRQGAGVGDGDRTASAFAEELPEIVVAFVEGASSGPAEQVAVGGIFGGSGDEAAIGEQAGDIVDADLEDAGPGGAADREPPEPEPADPEPGPLPEIEPLVSEYLEARAPDREPAAERIRSRAATLRERGGHARLASAVETLAEGAREGTGDAGAVELAREILTPGAAVHVVAGLGELREEAERARKVEIVAGLGPEMASPISDALADTSDRAARRAYIEAMVALGDEGMDEVERMMEDSRWFVVRNGATILGEVGGEHAIEHLTSTLAHEDPRVRRETVMALAKVGGEDAGILLVGMIDDPEAEVRAAVAMALGVLRVERAVRPLLQRLEEEDDEDVSVQIIRALGQLGDPGAVQAIEKRAVASFFSRPPRPIRIAAYKALSDIGTPHAVELLEEAAEDRDEEVRQTVREILKGR